MSRRKKSFSRRLYNHGKWLLGHLQYYLLRLWTTLAKILPSEFFLSCGEKFGAICFYLLARARKIALNNLHLALGREKSKDEINQICRDVFRNIGRDMMETYVSLRYGDHHLRTLVKIEGKEHLDQALKQGKGVIMFSPHLGNFPLMCIRLAREGYPVSTVAKESKNPKIVKYISSMRSAVGIESIPPEPITTCIERCFKVLRENRILFILTDLKAPTTEPWVDFFGYLVPTFRSPVLFSLRTGARIVPMFIIRNSHQLHQISIHPPFDLTVTKDRQGDITSNIARLTKITEAAIREHPEQWWWVLPRFKRARDIRTGEPLSHKRF